MLSLQGIFVSINLVNIVILTILTLITIQGFIRLRERNTKLLSLSFLSFLLGNIFYLSARFFLTQNIDSETQFVTGINIMTAGTLMNMLAIAILIYAFYKNKDFNNVLLKRSHLFFIILASFLVSFTATILLYDSYPGSFPYSATIYNDLIWVFGSVAISILLIALLVMLTKYYGRTQNTHTLYIIAGFSALFLEYVFSWIIYLIVNSNGIQRQWADVLLITQSLIPSIAYLLFLLALIRARVRE